MRSQRWIRKSPPGHSIWSISWIYPELISARNFADTKNKYIKGVPIFHTVPCNHNIKHAMVSDPEEAGISLPFAAMSVLTSTSLTVTVSSFPARQLRSSIPSTFLLTAYLLAVLRLKLYVAIQPPRTCCPVVGQPSGAGFTPAGLHDLARPH